MRPIVSAEIIAVGSELLSSTRVDTNSLYITARLNEIGIAVRAKAVVGDSREDLKTLYMAALPRADLVLLTGGLGPTDDDVTREVIAEALGRPLQEHSDILERIRARFATRGLEMPAINRRQAMVPAGAEVLPNPRGTAPGLWIEDGHRITVLLPGPPVELRPMVDALVHDRLHERASGLHLCTRTVRIAGRSESHVELAAQPLYNRWRHEKRSIEVTILASPGTIDLHLTVSATESATGDEALRHAVAELREIFADDVYSDDGRSMEEVVGALLLAARYTVGVAESCTGGLLTSRLTDVPGSSSYVDRCLVAYSNDAKTGWLGVAPELILEHGAVSEPVAAAMAAGIRARAQTTVGIGVTGIAGPAGGSPEKPVGTVAIATDGPWGRTVRTRRFVGGREQIKWQASTAALDDVRRAILSSPR
jgi:nicotinamide-nucleotide amidase